MTVILDLLFCWLRMYLVGGLCVIQPLGMYIEPLA